MRSAWIVPVVALAGAVGLASFQPAPSMRAEASTMTLEHPAQLSPAPGASPMAVLMAGTRVQLIEERDGWSHVTVEGWIPAPSGKGAGASPMDSAPPAEPPAAASEITAARASLEGVLFVTGKDGRTAAGMGVVVRLLAQSSDMPEKLNTVRADCAARYAELTARAEELKQQAGRALRSIDSATRAFEESDRARAQRRQVLQERAKLSRECHAREDELLEAHAAYRALANAEGRYRFVEVAPGSYTLQATLETEGQRHQWMVPVTVESKEARTLDLTPGNRVSVEDLPQGS